MHHDTNQTIQVYTNGTVNIQHIHTFFECFSYKLSPIIIDINKVWDKYLYQCTSFIVDNYDEIRTNMLFFHLNDPKPCKSVYQPFFQNNSH